MQQISQFDRDYILKPFSSNHPRRGFGSEYYKKKSLIFTSGSYHRIDLLKIDSLDDIIKLMIEFEREGIHQVRITKRLMRDDFGPPIKVDLEVIGKVLDLMEYRSMFVAFSDCYISLTIGINTENNCNATLNIELV